MALSVKSLSVISLTDSGGSNYRVVCSGTYYSFFSFVLSQIKYSFCVLHQTLLNVLFNKVL